MRSVPFFCPHKALREQLMHLIPQSGTFFQVSSNDIVFFPKITYICRTRHNSRLSPTGKKQGTRTNNKQIIPKAMKFRFIVAAMAALTVIACGNNSGKKAVKDGNQDFYSISVKNADGADVSMADYSGKVLLIVNTATKCGFTPQYEELEALYEQYRSKGFEILDFPCNQFGGQAPGTAAEIKEFCTSNYNTQFPQFAKIDVNGENADPLFTYLKSQKGFEGFDLENQTGQMLDNMFRRQNPDYDKNPDIKWNFTKFLVDKKGNVVARFEPTDKPSDISGKIVELL